MKRKINKLDFLLGKIESLPCDKPEAPGLITREPVNLDVRDENCERPAEMTLE